MFRLKSRANRNYIKIYECPDSGEKFGLITVNGDMKHAILKNLQTCFATQGSHVKTGGVLSELCIPSMLVGGSGALSITAAASGSLFVATANPATLMTIGNGVGSAVMGASGIIGQAPFVAVSGALMPVAAPMLAFQALSTIILMQQFNTVNDKLNSMHRTINSILRRNEATFIGELISAGSRLDTLSQEFNIAHRFTSDMEVRLALIEGKVNPYFERYHHLFNMQRIDASLLTEDLTEKNTDAYLATLLSVLDLQIDVLRLKLALQEDPAFVNTLASGLVEKVERYQLFWKCVEDSPQQVEGLLQTFQDTINAMNGWQKTMPRWLGGKRDQRKSTEYAKTAFSELNARSKTNTMIETARSAMEFGKTITHSVEQVALLYWEDEHGKHSYYTSDLIIK